MGEKLCLLNLDTGDFIDLGKVFWFNEAVPEMGYEGGHLLVNNLPSLPYDKDGKYEAKPSWREITRHRGHALNTFLASSVGCRFILVWDSEILDRLGDVEMECFGHLDDTEKYDGILSDEGEFISEATNFYRKRLSKTGIKGPQYEYSDDEDKNRIEKKQRHYQNEIQRALDMNKVSRSRIDLKSLDQDSGKQDAGKVEEYQAYIMGQKPAEPSI